MITKNIKTWEIIQIHCKYIKNYEIFILYDNTKRDNIRKINYLLVN